jgi:hypothetical protein
MIHFLAGLPRSGSTVLAAIFNQNPLLQATSTSGLHSLIGAAVAEWNRNPTFAAQQKNEEDLLNIIRAIVESQEKSTDKPILIDKSRSWAEPNTITSMEKVLGRKMKIIATVRNVADCAASFVRLSKPENLGEYINFGGNIQYLKSSFITLKSGYETFADRFHFVEYENLLSNPELELKKIHDFLEIPHYQYDFNSIDGSTVKENDEDVWKIPGLHEVAPVLKKQTDIEAKEVLKHFYEDFTPSHFWRENDLPVKHLIDEQLEAGLNGDFVRGKEISDILEKTQPDNDKAAFNRGWYLIRQGKLIEGVRYLDRGRNISAFGNPPVSGAPIWDGYSNGVVLLVLEGGLGDQIHQVRYAKIIAERGSKVVVSCDQSLAHLFKNLDNVTALVASEAAGYIYHDWQVPGMSAPAILGIDFDNVDGNAYIQKTNEAKNIIGLRWAGNPKFEHEQYRTIDTKLLFDNLKSIGQTFVSLQRDEGAELKPNWVLPSNLDTWIDTQKRVSECKLVITSCTSVAHLAGSMGVPTWILVPILPYYMWALPGDKTPFYDSVTLFRQTKPNCWLEPINTIKTKLEKL